ncbi:MAG TPA: hypothetical protein DCK76_07425 [Desulfotomaculum sp.]|nr:MAG: hypothetical protein XD78_0620 [Desulfotomaculum sp. 46_296]HAG11196.1 hypothetical protein [Desulfotomaculum sp.]HBY03158.1 hypothetical protein [Desulfotomaculum sp.]
MVRKRCIGLVDNLPCCQKFIAEGQPNPNPLVLGIEELEAIRLKDMCGFDQSECAGQMGLSRPTFQRLLQAARNKIALALVEGRTIMIRGGNYVEKRRSFECVKCRHTWDEGTFSENGKRGYEISCPKCGSMEKYRVFAGVQKVTCNEPVHQFRRCQGFCCKNLLDSEEEQECRVETGKDL